MFSSGICFDFMVENQKREGGFIFKRLGKGLNFGVLMTEFELHDIEVNMARLGTGFTKI
jgi:hypothetical protein